MKKSVIAIIVISTLCVLFAPLSPWITEKFASYRAIQAFENQWKNTMDGCGVNCKDCGFKKSRKVLFGRKVEIEYACGLIPADLPEYHKKKELFVSLIGTVH